VVKFERFFELNVLVLAEFDAISSHSRMKYFALHEYCGYLARSIPFLVESLRSLYFIFWGGRRGLIFTVVYNFLARLVVLVRHLKKEQGLI